MMKRKEWRDWRLRDGAGMKWNGEIDCQVKEWGDEVMRDENCQSVEVANLRRDIEKQAQQTNSYVLRFTITHICTYVHYIPLPSYPLSSLPSSLPYFLSSCLIFFLPSLFKKQLILPHLLLSYLIIQKKKVLFVGMWWREGWVGELTERPTEQRVESRARD